LPAIRPLDLFRFAQSYAEGLLGPGLAQHRQGLCPRCGFAECAEAGAYPVQRILTQAMRGQGTNTDRMQA
jgi:hypothetical protein